MKKIMLLIIATAMTLGLSAQNQNVDSVKIWHTINGPQDVTLHVAFYGLNVTGAAGLRVYYGISPNLNENMTTLYAVSMSSDTLDIPVGGLVPAGNYIAQALINGPALGYSNVDTFNTPLCGFTATTTPAGGDTICSGQSILLTASAGTTYQWYKNNSIIAGATSQNYVATATGNYTVAVTDGGCTNVSQAFVLKVETAVTAAISGDTSVCQGSSLTLSATGGTSYFWSNGATTQGIIVSPTVSTTYGVTVSNSAGCSATASKTVAVKTNPIVTISGNASVCTGGSVTLTASGADTYTWSNGATTASITVSPAATAGYTVTGRNTGCTASSAATLTVSVNAIPTVAITEGATVSVCDGSSITLNATGAFNYVWSNGATTADNTVSPTSNTTYSVTGTSSTGCSATASIAVGVWANTFAVVAGTASNKYIVCNNAPNAQIELVGNPSGGTFSGDGVTGNMFDAASLPRGLYVITYTNASLNGCIASKSFSIRVEGPPANITYDLINESLVVSGDIPDPIKIKIGNLVYSATVQSTSEAIFSNVKNLYCGEFFMVQTIATGCFSYGSVECPSAIGDEKGKEKIHVKKDDLVILYDMVGREINQISSPKDFVQNELWQIEKLFDLPTGVYYWKSISGAQRRFGVL